MRDQNRKLQTSRVAARRERETRVIEIERNDPGIEPGAAERVIVGGPRELVAAPHDLAMPEGQRHLAGDDHPRRRDAFDQRPRRGHAAAEIVAFKPM